MKNVEIVYRYGSGDAVIRPRPADAGEARRRLDEGNRAFAALLDNVGEEGPAAGASSRSTRAISACSRRAARRRSDPTRRCSDAPMPACRWSSIFSEGPNDLFVVRVAGNGLGGDALGSLKYAVDHLGDSLKLVVVLGHSGCGAVTAAVDIFLDPAEYLSICLEVHDARPARPAPRRGALGREEDGGDLGSRRDAARRLPRCTRRSVRGLERGARGAYGAAGVEPRCARHARCRTASTCSGRTTCGRPRAGSVEVTGLADPPRDLDAFHGFGDAVMRSGRIAALLDRARE